ncbi:MAG: hypothetical protein UR43_C0010G0013 [candidate division TM6 bacterium GW2011_GWF2_33_332]|nr:MAG: hypothetical protein UR43_C0010G0013 [candidate division TM6 bacterium GW2011_GWF2_33_332]
MTQIQFNDFFSILEMMDGEKANLIMSVTTYKKILSAMYGIKDINSITNVSPNLNGIDISFDKSMSEDIVTIKARRRPYTRESIDVQLV